MLAALTLAGMPIRKAGATKIILASCINGAAVLIFLFSKISAGLKSSSQQARPRSAAMSPRDCCTKSTNIICA